MEKARTESHLSITSDDINIKLSKEFLEELKMNAYHKWIDEDVINHIAMINKGAGKITVWEELVEKFFCKFYPESYDGEEEMLDEGDDWEIDPLEFISRVNSSFDKHMKINGRTKKVLFHAWMNGNWNKIRINDIILRSNNTTTDSFFKPYLITHGKSDTKKEDEQSQTKRKYSNTSNSIDEQPKKEVFPGRQPGMLFNFIESVFPDINMATLEAKNIDEYWWRIYKSGDLEVLES
ncbi:hypothetical protein Tco_1155071 [Tanacetum coccineum]